MRYLEYARALGSPLIVAAALLVASPSGSNASGFMVRPLMLEVRGRPGERLQRELELVNTKADERASLNVRTFLLTQDAFGGWKVVESGAGEGLPSGARSCAEWVNVPTGRVELGPGELRKLPVQITLPVTARGTYFSAIAIESVPRAPTGRIAIAVVIRFLVVVKVDTEGPPCQRLIKLQDTGMEFIKGGEKQQPTTKVSMTVADLGETSARIGGTVRVFRQFSRDWRLVTTAVLAESRILPGSVVTLQGDLKRRLPPGKYKLDASLQIDGQMAQQLAREIDFAGDPTVTAVASDVPFRVDPPVVSVAAPPGSNRATTVTVENPTDQPLEVRCRAETPDNLRRAFLGEENGEAYSCANWVQVSPDVFTLAPNRQRKLRIGVAPPGDASRANYYAHVVLQALYPGGDSAGESQVLLCVMNERVQPKRDLRILTVSIAQEEGSMHAVTATAQNFGDAALWPECSIVLTLPTGVVLARAKMEGDVAPLLPLCERRYSGIVDFSEIPVGPCVLTCKLQAEKLSAQRALSLKVSEQEGKKVVEVVQDVREASNLPTKGQE